MKLGVQLVVIALLGAVAVPVSARFVPGTHPWLDRIGLLGPLTTAGLVQVADADNGRPGQGARGAGDVPVMAVPVETRALQDVLSVIGSGQGAQAADLAFGVTGRIVEIPVAPSDQVKAGTVIARLDAAGAQLSVDRARLVLEDAQRTVTRLDQLAQSGTATSLQRQEAELALRTAELELQIAERTLADHQLLAPIPGFVGLIGPQPGDLVTPSTVITRIEDRSTLALDFRVPERLASLMRLEDTVSATAISLPDSTVEGRITALDNRVDEASRTLRVKASIANPKDRLRAGMAFRIDLAFTGASYSAVDPLSIQWGTDGAYVWVVREAKATRLPIGIVQRNADFVLVEGAFLPEDLVVTEGVNLLRPGASVAVTPPRS
ncbi:efflux RND transporter periplasmic adaptor subunit [Tabrizicola sp.]|uniref:efflux RND transporter periplasmic adaptor subunit n=1 Tax=Tabrizicola sp. TaxID=2005166 RepID=UPI0027360B05|nr:efflux RND transporter periplasmic adaptor subunit [Tabrizicola sp.]MDP3194635.1 efflux RND transporter periplasmic adaptor subunit [Tabrizicola sp.]